MAQWRQFANRQKAKRTKNDKKNDDCRREEIVVQRMSSEVSGKQQKYNRIGAREYVPFDSSDELTVPNIIEACRKFFADTIEKDMVCDVLAGERGPSCRRVAQIPDLKVFYVRFVKRQDTAEDDDTEPTIHSIKPKRTRYQEKHLPKKTASLPSPQKQTHQSKPYPKSLSVLEILKLGKVISKKTSTLIELHKFDLVHMEWCSVPLEAELIIEDEAFASGGFRQAFKASSLTAGFSDVTWVVKKYLPGALEVIRETNQTQEEHTRKAVQGHYLARNFAWQLKEKVEKDELEYGNTFEYKKVFMGKLDVGEYVTVEEYIDGQFVKYINNNGDLCEKDSILCRKAESLAHYSYEKSQGKVMVLDIQGSDYTLYDPEIASFDQVDEEGAFQFCTGNLAGLAINNFFSLHKCNYYCNLLNLKLRPA